MVEEILKMYFEEHMKQKDIAEFFKVSSEYVSKVVRNDDRYPEEKQRRHQEAKLRKAKYNKEYLETYKNFKRKAPLKLSNNIYLHRCYAEKTKNKTSTKAIYETVFQ